MSDDYHRLMMLMRYPFTIGSEEEAWQAGHPGVDVVVVQDAEADGRI